jgi:hypothetical protein
MAIRVQNNRVYLYQINLGHDFVDMTANATVDQFGRVRVYVPPATRIPSFYTTVDCLPKELIRLILDRLDHAGDNRRLTKLKASTLRAFLSKGGG